MKVFKKNQIIITALAIMIAVAGYINFTDRADLDESSDVFNNVSVADIEDDSYETSGTLVPNESVDEELIEGIIVEDDILLEAETEGVEGTTDGDATTDTTELEDVGDIGEAAIIVDEAMADSGDDIVGEAVLVSSTSVETAFFLEAKIDREQTRAYSVEILLEVINNESIAEEQKIMAATQMIELQERIEMEAAAESVLEAKGFENVFVRVDETDVDVVVSADSLSDVELAQIYDVVSRKTGFEADSITITPLQINN